MKSLHAGGRNWKVRHGTRRCDPSDHRGGVIEVDVPEVSVGCSCDHLGSRSGRKLGHGSSGRHLVDEAVANPPEVAVGTGGEPTGSTAAARRDWEPSHGTGR